MLSKKAAGLIGLGATMTGAVGSQMTSAGLLDLMVGKERDVHLEKMFFAKYREGAKNIIRTICANVDGEDRVKILSEVKKCVSNETDLTIEQKEIVQQDEFNKETFGIISEIINKIEEKNVENFREEMKKIISKVMSTEVKNPDAIKVLFWTKYKPIKELKGMLDLFTIEKFYWPTDDDDDSEERSERLIEKDKKATENYERRVKIISDIYYKLSGVANASVENSYKIVEPQDKLEIGDINKLKEIDPSFEEHLNKLGNKNAPNIKKLQEGLNEEEKNTFLNILKEMEMSAVRHFYRHTLKGRVIVLQELGFWDDEGLAVTAGKNALTAYATGLVKGAFFGAHTGSFVVTVASAMIGATMAVAANTATSTGVRYFTKEKDLMQPKLNAEIGFLGLLINVFKEKGADGVRGAVKEILVKSVILPGTEEIVEQLGVKDLIDDISGKVTKAVEEMATRSYKTISGNSAILAPVVYILNKFMDKEISSEEVIAYVEKQVGDLAKGQLESTVKDYTVNEIADLAVNEMADLGVNAIDYLKDKYKETKKGDSENKDEKIGK